MTTGPERVLVTGCAGFIGSHVVEALLDRGVEVVGLDCLTPYYQEARKRENLGLLQARTGFELREVDLRTDPLAPHLHEAGVVVHLAAQPGVRASWAHGFRATVEHNVLATQRLLEAAREVGVARFVHASSSSVYGDVAATPLCEEGPLRPYSPYGITKQSAEQLCAVYAANWGVPTVALRYFTVYGPRQRPDMALHRMVEAALLGTSFPLFGDGSQRRDVTYVDDVVAATLAALDRPVAPGTVCNVAGGSRLTVADMLAAVERQTGATIALARHEEHPGDVRSTDADHARARELLGWRPTVDFEEGLRRQLAWHRAATRP